MRLGAGSVSSIVVGGAVVDSGGGGHHRCHCHHQHSVLPSLAIVLGVLISLHLFVESLSHGHFHWLVVLVLPAPCHVCVVPSAHCTTQPPCKQGPTAVVVDDRGCVVVHNISKTYNK
jgi:hypothetical protein